MCHVGRCVKLRVEHRQREVDIENVGGCPNSGLRGWREGSLCALYALSDNCCGNYIQIPLRWAIPVYKGLLCGTDKYELCTTVHGPPLWDLYRVVTAWHTCSRAKLSHCSVSVNWLPCLCVVLHCRLNYDVLGNQLQLGSPQ